MQKTDDLLAIAKNTLEFNNRRMSNLRRKINNYLEDNEKEERLKLNLCKWCYYMKVDEVVMNAFTTQICRRCATTDINMYCDDCAKTINVCKHCGSSMD